MDKATDCGCLVCVFEKGENFEQQYLGMDERYGEVSLLTCTPCGRRWLRYYYVNESFSRSGRWYHGLLPPGSLEDVTVEKALEILGKLDWYWCGGSWYEGKVLKAQGPPDLWP